jgi:putative nucleotidyltransferase with HDIG domain
MRTTSLREELLTKASAITVLPTLDVIIDKIIKLLTDENASFHELVEVVKYDPAMSAKIISIANSAYFARASQIVNLQRAMVAIGMEETRRIILCLALLTEMRKQWRLSQEDLAYLWRHSCLVAHAAKLLAQRTMTEDPEKVFTLGILHDIGKAAFFAFPDSYGTVRAGMKRTGHDTCALEKEVFGIDHTELGYLISVKWRFPEEFGTVIQGHHGPLTGQVLEDIVITADRFIENPESCVGPEAVLLQREQSQIEAETERIVGLLGIADRN